MSYHRLPTAPLASGQISTGDRAVDNQQPQGSTYLRSKSVQSSGAPSEFVDIPTFRIHDSEFSLSKSDAYVQAEVGVLRKILKLNLHSDVTRSVRVKTGRAYHRLSTYHRRLGHLGRAWRYHLASLVYPGGAGFLPYSRRLLPFWPIDREDSSFR